MKNETTTTTTLKNKHHIAIRVALVSSIRKDWKLRQDQDVRQLIKDSICTLRLVRNSWKLESTPWSHATR
jgi:hypothetical protein